MSALVLVAAWTAVVAGVVAPPTAQAQAPASPVSGKTFEVASVKPNDSGRTGFSIAPVRGTLTATNVTLKMLITTAYRVQGSQVIEGPKWTESARFDVVGKGAEGTTNPELSAMLRALLADRFKLVIRQETREQPVFALLVSKKGPKLGKPEEGNCAQALKASQPCGTMGVLRGGIRADNQPLSVIANALGGMVRRMVIDKTGLTGKYDVYVGWKPEGQQAVAEEVPRGQDVDAPESVFVALEEQVGLRLESQKAPVPVIVIESAETPTPN